jgi:hypothetical protein
MVDESPEMVDESLGAGGRAGRACEVSLRTLNARSDRGVDGAACVISRAASLCLSCKASCRGARRGAFVNALQKAQTAAWRAACMPPQAREPDRSPCRCYRAPLLLDDFTLLSAPRRFRSSSKLVFSRRRSVRSFRKRSFSLCSSAMRDRVPNSAVGVRATARSSGAAGREPVGDCSRALRQR